ncbi:MAG: bifunctional phosphoribosyl-AMP cyclohydrolase/phosphoribosyl-ATP diphosphatase HisIE [Candidatus Kerfeldbacteria bacterium]|nr:bifunctional phosphoribosyl-AMP cyclohydrolase/phosphoribosyl-ATP diphosphatase HisIE [Candidatus Kerfeldbacteria bacterium]
MNLTPTIIQDASTKQVLMLGYMSEESLAKTRATGRVWFYSRSKQRLWEKGETSHNYLNVVDIFEDCDNDTLLITTQPEGPTCHTGQISCFGEATPCDALAKLEKVIQQRKTILPEESYTTSLFQAGLDRISVKVLEEAAEVVRAATKETPQRLTEETVDLLYHVLVLLVQQGVGYEKIMQELQRREAS